MRITTLYCCIFIAISGLAYAQPAMDLGRIVVTPRRVVEPEGGISSNVTVITPTDIERMNAGSVVQVLEREAGIHVYDKGSAKTAVIDMRGYGDTAASNVLVLVNGRRINPVDISGPDLLQVPLASVERIEIIRASGSVLYGDNATGGVINIITREGEGSLSGSLLAEGGSHSRQHYALSMAGKENQVGYYFYSGYGDDGGYRDNSQLSMRDHQLRLSLDPHPQLALNLEGGWHQDDYGLPGGISMAGLAAGGRRATTHPADYGNTQDRFIKASLALRPLDGAKGEVTLDISRRLRDTFGNYDYGIWGSTTTARGIRTDALNLKYAARPRVAGRDLDLVTGIDYSRARNHILGGGSGLSASTDDLFIVKESLGVYGQADCALTDKFSVNTGARREQADYTFDRHDVPAYIMRAPQAAVFSGGMTYAYAPRSNVFAAVQETFRFLATDEWYDTWSGLNADLKQQSGVEYQIGLKHAFDAVAEFHLMPFYSVNHDEIFLDPTLGGAGRNSNYDVTRRRGVDAGLDLHLAGLLGVRGVSGFDVFLKYTWLDPVFGRGAFKGQRIPMVPRDKLALGLDVVLAGGLGLNLTGSFTGSQYAINDLANATDPVKPYWVVDSKLTYDLGKDVQIYAGIRNLLAEKYYSYVVKSASGTNKDYYPAPEREFTAGMKYVF